MNTDVEVKVMEYLNNKDYNGLRGYLDNTGWSTIPSGLLGNAEETKKTIEFLKILSKIQEEKIVYNTKGIKNKIRYHLLGYALVNK